MPHDADFPEPSTAQAAAEWVARRDRGLTDSEARAFSAWRASDPRHERALERLTDAWRQLDSAQAAPELEAMADAFLVRARLKRRRRQLLRTVSVSVAAAAALAVGVLTWERYVRGGTGGFAVQATENYRVIASTMQRTTLPDGSVAELNGTSRIEVDFNSTERRVRLVDGEAHFIVVSNPDQPFFVTAGPVTVRAVGTAFNVRLQNASIEVLVTEGKVKLEQAASVVSPKPDVSPALETPALVQGQRAVINLTAVDESANVAIAEVNPSEITDALGWQSTRLVFSNTPLDEVVAGFNHYNTHQLTLGDPRLRSRTLTGVFRADNVEGFVRLLRASADVKSERRSPIETILLPAR